MKRFFASVLAVLLLLAGLALAAVGGFGLAVFGTTGTYEGPTASVGSSGTSVAIIADLSGVEVGVPFHERLGNVTLSIRSPDGVPMFLGRADQASVDTYLFGQPYDLATKDSTWHTIAVPGTETSIAAPDTQTFWTASATGTTANITMDSGQQTETLVMMNADGSPPVNAQLWLGFAGEQIFAYCAGAIAAGAVLVLIGLAWLVRIQRRARRAKVAAKRAAVVPSPAQPAATEPTNAHATTYEAEEEVVLPDSPVQESSAQADSTAS